MSPKNKSEKKMKETLLATIDSYLSPFGEILSSTDDINRRDPNGNTALLLAARDGHIEIVRGLLQYSETSVNEKDQYGNTGLIWASQY
jgi:ankyrin repeat protein